ncbi:MAG TPA: response regulator transcription factor [Bryobacteraceae bacterium]|nr:response regulator transcription factor [Bryobacteraceae bacterium]
MRPESDLTTTGIKVSIVEDNGDLRSEFAHLVDGADGLRRVSDYANAEDALANLPADNPDVVLMDIQLPGMTGVECVRRLKVAAPSIQVVMLTVFEHTDWIFDSLKAGASGYVLKRAPRGEIVEAIRQVHDGGAPMSCSVARKVVQFFNQRNIRESDLKQLSEREHTVLTKLSEGLSYDEIAEALAISINTVRKHIRGIYEKLQVNSRTEAVAKFLRR